MREIKESQFTQVPSVLPFGSCASLVPHGNTNSQQTQGPILSDTVRKLGILV